MVSVWAWAGILGLRLGLVLFVVRNGFLMLMALCFSDDVLGGCLLWLRLVCLVLFVLFGWLDFVVVGLGC